MKIALGQINPIIGDFEGNIEKILEAAERSLSKGAHLVVFPELSVCGYPPMDLLDYDDFIERNISSLHRIADRLPPGMTAVVGYVDKNLTAPGKPLRNATAVVSEGNIIHTQYKTLLPTYDVFDEARYFEPATEWKVFEYQGHRFGIAVCEDIWREEESVPGTDYVSPVSKLAEQDMDMLIVPSASPFFVGKNDLRYAIASDIAGRHAIPVVYVNMAGGNDSIIFDGNSFIMTPEGLLEPASAFSEDLLIADPFEKSGRASIPVSDPPAETAKALAFGLAEYAGRCGFSRVHLGLSGGIDSAVTACVAVEAMGSDNVTAIAMPSRYSSEESLQDAEELAESLGIKLEVIPIEKIFSSTLESLETVFKGLPPNVTEENIQARARGMLLMAYSNKFNSLLLETGNKSELATGYCTLYGDMCGGLAPLGDLFKTEVYRLADYYNRNGTVIPGRIISKAPSAELRPDQKDEDSLPPYPLLDEILKDYLMDNLSMDELIEKGFDRHAVELVLGLVARSEYKRIQAPPVLKVSPRAFGSGRRMPVARFVYEV